MQGDLVYLVILLGIAGIVGIAFFLRGKGYIKSDDIVFGKEVLVLLHQAIGYLNSVYNFKYENEIENVIKYTIEALKFVEEHGDFDTLEDLSQAIFAKASEICEENGVEVTYELVELLNLTIHFLINRIDLTKK